MTRSYVSRKDRTVVLPPHLSSSRQTTPSGETTSEETTTTSSSSMDDTVVGDNLNYDDGRSVSSIPTSSYQGYRRRKLVLYVLGGITVLVAVAVILGSVLGMTLPLSKSSTSPTNSNVRDNDTTTPDTTADDTEILPDPSAFGTKQSHVQVLLRSVSSTAGIEFDDPTSYQSRALQWVESHPTKANNNNNHNGLSFNDRTIQRYALACIYYATNLVPNAYTKQNLQHGTTLQGWVSDKGWMVDDDECSWKGIDCANDNNNNNNNGRVTHIDLSRNLLSGSFPSEVTLLKESLVFLDLYKNMVYNYGPDGNDFFGELTNLQYLYLSRCNFEYPGIPKAFGKLTNLIELDLSYTLYFGQALGAETIFGGMTHVKSLDLSGLDLQGPIPTVLGELPNLESLYIVYSGLDGDLEILETGSWPRIFELWLDMNPDLRGSIPDTLGHLDTLTSLSITSCDLTGGLPTQLGQLTNMQQMFFYNNSLSGPIPSELGNLHKMETLELEMNHLSGPMPMDVCFLTAARLTVLEADCQTDGSGTIDCSVMSQCCTCCGPQCAEVDNRHVRTLVQTRSSTERKPLVRSSSRMHRS